MDGDGLEGELLDFARMIWYYCIENCFANNPALYVFTA